jgi:hypothetical protein
MCELTRQDTAGEWHDNNMGEAWHSLIKAARHGKGTAWARHGMRELKRNGM